MSELDEKIKSYCEKKEEEKSLKKVISQLNDSLKSEFSKIKDKTLKSDKYAVTIEERVTEGFDEYKLINVLKTFWQSKYGRQRCPFIKTVECIDEECMKTLESYIYRGDIPKDVLTQIDACRTKKVTTALTYKIAKEK